MKKELYFISLIFSTLIIILSICLVNVTSLAVSSSYGAGYPLKIYPGETKDIQFGLMTNPGEDNLIVKAELLNDDGIASLIDSNLEYKVNAGDIVPVNLRVKVDKTAKAEQKKYNIVIKLSDISPSEGAGSVLFKGSSIINFDVVVLGEELKETKGTTNISGSKGTGILFIFGFFVLILLIAIIIIIWVVMRKRRKEF
jgi:hypothetical protein